MSEQWTAVLMPETGMWRVYHNGVYTGAISGSHVHNEASAIAHAQAAIEATPQQDITDLDEIASED